MYFQCLASLVALIERGLESLGHSNNLLYYELILKAEKPGDIPTNSKRVDCEELLARTSIVEVPEEPVEGAVFSDHEMSDGELVVDFEEEEPEDDEHAIPEVPAHGAGVVWSDGERSEVSQESEFPGAVFEEDDNVEDVLSGLL